MSSNPTIEIDTNTAFKEAFELCIDKIQRSIPQIAGGRKTASFDLRGNYLAWNEDFFEIGNWTTSFFTGMALLAYETTKDTRFLKEVNRMSGLYHDKVHRHGMNTMHDLGFLYSLYSVALWKLTGNPEQRALGIKAAEELAKRFVPKGDYFRAWGRTDDRTGEYAGLAIIDCMMNLPLLYWASQETGNPFFHQLAVKHADSTAKSFIRPDDSVCHAFRFDESTGKPVREDNYCGASIGTHWARGTTWAIYGFALSYVYSGKKEYLDISQRLARKFVSLLDEEIVPIWDFRRGPHDPSVRDSSAAAIGASAFYLLSDLVPSDPFYVEHADRLLTRLAEKYVDRDLNVLGILKDGQVGRGKAAYTSWGDYYFMEALARRNFGFKGYW